MKALLLQLPRKGEENGNNNKRKQEKQLRKKGNSENKENNSNAVEKHQQKVSLVFVVDDNQNHRTYILRPFKVTKIIFIRV